MKYGEMYIQHMLWFFLLQLYMQSRGCANFVKCEHQIIKKISLHAYKNKVTSTEMFELKVTE